MKKLLVIIFLLICQPSIANVKETWVGEFRTHGDRNLWGGAVLSEVNLIIILKINRNINGTFSGDLELSGQSKCRGVVKIEIGEISGDLVSFKTEPFSLIGCPSVTFSGKITDEIWAGVLPWNGINCELILKKK
jgi:hypothetical protein